MIALAPRRPRAAAIAAARRPKCRADDIERPGAEFEPVSPLDVPAFLRRQSEA